MVQNDSLITLSIFMVTTNHGYNQQILKFVMTEFDLFYSIVVKNVWENKFWLSGQFKKKYFCKQSWTNEM